MGDLLSEMKLLFTDFIERTEDFIATTKAYQQELEKLERIIRENDYISEEDIL